LATLIATGLSQGQTLSDLMEPLMAALCYEAETDTRFPKLLKRLTWAIQVKGGGAVCASPQENNPITRLNARF